MTGLFTHRNFSLSDTPPLDGKVALVTGGQAGIGREIANHLLAHHIQKLFILGRTRNKFDDAVEYWQRQGHLKPDDSSVTFVPCDLSDILAVKKAAEQVLDGTNRLDILICNAGLGVQKQREYHTSEQEIETTFAANVVGHQVLVTLLLPILKKTVVNHDTDVRIVVTSSSMHRLCKELDLDALKSPTPTKPIYYDGIWRYSRSKLGDILFTRELSRRLLAEAGSDPSSRRIYVNTFFPGNIATEQMDVWNDYFGAVFGRLFKLFFSLFGQSPTDGAATAVYLATSPEVTKGDGMRGEYFIPIATKDRTTAIAEDMTLARAAWDWVDKQAAEALGDRWQTAETIHAESVRAPGVAAS